MAVFSGDGVMKIGVLINPLAGIGGSVALKGSDGEAIVEQALARGAEPLAQQRAAVALSKIARHAGAVRFISAGGDMGETVLRELGVEPQVVYQPPVGRTTAKDTTAAVHALCDAGIELLVFAGGDGTARDVLNALRERQQDESLPVLGIPAGCKIHSAVYAVSPQHAADLLDSLARATPLALKPAQVMDLDEELFRQGTVKASHYGYLLAPEDSSHMQVIKQGGIDYETTARQDIAAEVVANMEDDVLYLIGSGSTTAAVMEELQLDNTLLGVDAVLNHELIASDVDEQTILQLCEQYPARIVVTLIGGQGHIFGRGNQQFSAKVLRKVGRDNVLVIASDAKLRSLEGRPLRIDSGDDALDSEWRGAVQVITGYEQKTLYPIA